jgi:hypothetical protein
MNKALAIDVIEMHPNQMMKEFDVSEMTDVFVEVADEKGQFNLKAMD